MDKATQRKIQFLVIFIMNTIPFAGMKLWQWNVFQIIFLYWLESTIIGVFAVFELSELEDGYGMPAWTEPPSTGNMQVFTVIYFPVLLFYLFWISRILGGSLTQSPIEILRPFAPQILLFALAFTCSYSFRYRAFLDKAQHANLSSFKYFFSPFLRLVLVHALLATSVLWINYRHAAFIFFSITSILKCLIDFAFYEWHEIHVPPVIKDREFFGV